MSGYVFGSFSRCAIQLLLETSLFLPLTSGVFTVQSIQTCRAGSTRVCVRDLHVLVLQSGALM